MYREHAAPPELSGIIRASWSVQAAPGGGAQLVLPDGCSDLIFFRSPDGRTDLRVVGAMTTALVVPGGPGEWVGIRLQPQAAGALLGDAAAFQDRAVEASAVWGRAAAELHEQLQGLPARAAGEVMRAFIGQRSAPVDARVAWAVSALEAGGVRPGAVAEGAGLSGRQLARLFASQVGLSPRSFARSARLQRTLPLLRSPGQPLAQVACAAGFADQAHLTREWVDLTGRTPGAWRAGHV